MYLYLLFLRIAYIRARLGQGYNKYEDEKVKNIVPALSRLGQGYNKYPEIAPRYMDFLNTIRTVRY